MSREQIISTLRSAFPALRLEFPVRSLALFGSAARGDARPDSDIDILVQFEPGAPVTLFTLARLLTRLQALLGPRVDLIEDHDGLGPRFRAAIERDLCRVA
ncbi:MAG: nucleotidyltransferase family protein [Phycisphaerales bacterium]